MSLAALLRDTGLDGDTGQNLPERRETLEAQQRALRERRQRAQMFPVGTAEGPLPDGMERVETPRGVFHFDPEQVTGEDIVKASAAGRENDVLGLGPASKGDVMARADRGEPVAAVVERDPMGREIKAAIATPSTAPAAAAAGAGESGRGAAGGASHRGPRGGRTGGWARGLARRYGAG